MQDAQIHTPGPDQLPSRAHLASDEIGGKVLAVSWTATDHRLGARFLAGHRVPADVHQAARAVRAMGR
jgi:hypothetical protein